mmetsp:Transcript_81041/g.235029  ORF Transcript_81041/g.235029 Transcript_81041/m.235029 type:complete len:210 (-) Transcript_81041:9-638(-)
MERNACASGTRPYGLSRRLAHHSSVPVSAQHSSPNPMGSLEIASVRRVVRVPGYTSASSSHSSSDHDASGNQRGMSSSPPRSSRESEGVSATHDGISVFQRSSMSSMLLAWSLLACDAVAEVLGSESEHVVRVSSDHLGPSLLLRDCPTRSLRMSRSPCRRPDRDPDESRSKMHRKSFRSRARAPSARWREAGATMSFVRAMWATLRHG